MARLIVSILVFLFLSALYLQAEPPDHPMYQIDWRHTELRVFGYGTVSEQDRGNMIEWQLNTARIADQNLLRNFLDAMRYVQVDAFQSGHDVLAADLQRNERMYRYNDTVSAVSIRYGDNDVTVTKVFPFFGKGGFATLLFRAGKDYGNFPTYESTYTPSTNFTGLVIDARNLGHIPAIAPRIFDEEHKLIYTADFIRRERFDQWGAVQYTVDPLYRDHIRRVGDNPFRIVARRDDKLMPTDISIFTEDAQVLLAREATRSSLEEGRVIIILEEDAL
jgi:hypothetical protein